MLLGRMNLETMYLFGAVITATALFVWSFLFQGHTVNKLTVVVIGGAFWFLVAPIGLLWLAVNWLTKPRG